MRNKLGTEALTDRLFDKCRTLETNPTNDYPFDRKYTTIILGNLVMRTGAKIRDRDLKHLRDIVPDITCRAQYAGPFADGGFRLPGKVQFIAALDHYQEGVPRNFADPR